MTDKLKVGILDLLTLLLPGGFLLAVLLPKTSSTDSFIPLPALDTPREWHTIALYIGLAYVLGHFVFFVASYLDGWIFENVQKVFWKDKRLTAYVVKLKADITGINDRKIINAFKWSCAWLLKNQPAMYAEVERYIAESKFFRSLVIVSLISFLILSCKGDISFAFLLLLLSFLSLIRYLTQRQKSIETAYLFMITASGKSFKNEPDAQKLFEVTRSLIKTKQGNDLKYELRRHKIIAANLKAYSRKIGKVLELSFSPFYIHDIRPQGSPQYKSKEIRWFFTHEVSDFEDWFRQNMLSDSQPEIRTDIYYVKEDMDDMSIKLRSGKSFEIKQKIAEDEKIQLTSNMKKEVEEWGKWSVDEKDGNVFLKMLVLKKYRTYSVKKERWAVKITRNYEGKIIINDAGAIVDKGCQLEYTKIVINGKDLYSFAAEWFGYGLINIEETKKYPLFDHPELEKKETSSYSKLLDDLFTKKFKSQ